MPPRRSIRTASSLLAAMISSRAPFVSPGHCGQLWSVLRQRGLPPFANERLGRNDGGLFVPAIRRESRGGAAPGSPGMVDRAGCLAKSRRSPGLNRLRWLPARQSCLKIGEERCRRIGRDDVRAGCPAASQPHRSSGIRADHRERALVRTHVRPRAPPRPRPNCACAAVQSGRLLL